MGFCFGGIVAAASAAASYNSGHSYISPEDRKLREERRADESNRKWYPIIFQRMQNTLSGAWNVTAIDRGCGGTIYAQYKLHPNAYFILDMYYMGLHEKGIDPIEVKFYIDEKHWSNVTFSTICLFDDNEARRSKAVHDLNCIVERNIELYCKDNHIPIRENCIIFDLNGNNNWQHISKSVARNMNLREGAINKWCYVDTTERTDKYGSISFSATKIMDIELDTTQRFLLCQFVASKD